MGSRTSSVDVMSLDRVETGLPIIVFTSSKGQPVSVSLPTSTIDAMNPSTVGSVFLTLSTQTPTSTSAGDVDTSSSSASTPSPASSSSLLASGSPLSMSDTVSIGTNSMETWKIVLVALLPLFFVASGAAFAFWLYHRRHRAKTNAEVARLGTMLDDLKTNSHNVAIMTKNLEDGVERVRKLETELAVRETNLAQTHASWDPDKSHPYALAAPNQILSSSLSSPITPTPIPGFRCRTPAGPRLLAGTTAQGTLPHSAPGLEHRARPSSGTGSTHESIVFGDPYVFGPPFTIPEESSGHASSPFDTPVRGDDSSPVLQNPDSGQRDEVFSKTPRNFLKPGSILSPMVTLSPLKSNPSHPDLVPQPLAVVKRNSTVRESAAEVGSGVSRGINKTALRRSVSNPAGAKMYARADTDGQFATPPPEGDVRSSFVDEVSGIASPPPTAVVPLRERLDNGNGNGKRKDTSPITSKPPCTLTSMETNPQRWSVPARPLPIPSKLPRPRALPGKMPPPPSPSAKTRQNIQRRQSTSPSKVPTRPYAALNSTMRGMVGTQAQGRLSASYASSQCLPVANTCGTITTIAGDRNSISSEDDGKTKNTKEGPMGHSRLLSEMSDTLRYLDEIDELGI